MRGDERSVIAGPEAEPGFHCTGTDWTSGTRRESPVSRKPLPGCDGGDGCRRVRAAEFRNAQRVITSLINSGMSSSSLRRKQGVEKGGPLQESLQRRDRPWNRRPVGRVLVVFPANRSASSPRSARSLR